MSWDQVSPFYQGAYNQLVQIILHVNLKIEKYLFLDITAIEQYFVIDHSSIAR